MQRKHVWQLYIEIHLVHCLFNRQSHIEYLFLFLKEKPRLPRYLEMVFTNTIDIFWGSGVSKTPLPTPLPSTPLTGFFGIPVTGSNISARVALGVLHNICAIYERRIEFPEAPV